jgi:hypothetical protein
MKKFMIIGVLAVVGCDEASMTTAEGCPIMLTEIGQAYTQRSVANARAEQALAAGGSVSECFQAANGMTCVTN